MEQFSSNPSSTRRLLTFLESFKSQLPLLEEGGPVDAGRERVEGRLSVGSYRRATARDSLGGYQVGYLVIWFTSNGAVYGEALILWFSLADYDAQPSVPDQEPRDGGQAGAGAFFGEQVIDS